MKYLWRETEVVVKLQEEFSVIEDLLDGGTFYDTDIVFRVKVLKVNHAWLKFIADSLEAPNIAPADLDARRIRLHGYATVVDELIEAYALLVPKIFTP